MPIDYRRNLSYKSKCPADYHQRLRDPKCRAEMKQKEFSPVNPEPTPTPTPTPTPKPEPKPDPDTNT
jgi:hypothetical protein